MLNNRVKAAEQVAASLRSTEDAIDTALHLCSQLLVTMHTSRLTARLPHHTGQAEFSKVTKAVAILGEARDTILSAHLNLAETRDRVLPERMWGYTGKCRRDHLLELSENEKPTLRAVS